MSNEFPTLFSPIQLGSLTLKNRAVLTPHAHVVSSLWASDDEARGHIAYWKARTSAAWIDGVSAHVRNRMPDGFDPTGVGAQRDGNFRQPYFLDRVGELAETVHADGTALTVQMILQGGMPHGPSATLSGPLEHNVPHPMTMSDIEYFIEEYAFSAARAVEAGADGVELHLNHDDMLEWFVSPLTNQRSDEYGGDLSRRVEFPVRIMRAIRDAIGVDKLLGIRFNIREDEPGGYAAREGAQIVREMVNRAELNWISLTAGTPWGYPSYVQSQHHEPAEWAPLSAEIRKITDLPLVYTGRVNSPSIAEEVLAAGHADIVGFARAVLADGDLLVKAEQGRAADIRPCVAGNECINRRIVENTAFSCAVNPIAGREHRSIPEPGIPRKVLVVGGGPAGMEAAATAAERGHSVELWEATDALGGQLRTAARAPYHQDYEKYLAWQQRRLQQLPVRVRLNFAATEQDVLAHGADTVLLTTGATARTLEIPGTSADAVYTSVDVLDGRVSVLAGRVLVVAEDDHIAPLSAATFLGEQGYDVTVVFSSSRPAPLLSRYTLGSALGRMYDAGVTVMIDTAVTRIREETEGLRVEGRNVYTQAPVAIGDFGSVVLSAGAVPQASLRDRLEGLHNDVRVLGDAWAPRRLVWATRQGYEAAVSL